jgi:hypothetical protein
MSLKLNSSGGGSVTLQEPVTASDLTVNLPAFSGTAATLATVTNNGVLHVNSSGQPTSGSALTFDGTNLALTQSGNPTMTVKASGAGNNPSYRLQADTNYWEMVGVFSEADDNLRLRYNGTDVYIVGNTGISAWQVGGSEQMRLTSTGLGIGTSSPAARLDVTGASTTGTIHAKHPGNTSFGVVILAETTAGTDDPAIALRNFNGGSPVSYGIVCTDDGSLAFKSGINPTGGFGDERARIDSGGNLLVGTTSQVFAAGAKMTIRWDSANQQGITLQTSSTAFNGTAINFRNSSGVESGYILQAATSVSYVTSSDYRLKHDIQPMSGALAKVQQLKPVTYKWNADGSDGEGFIAHELQEVVPQCVTREKDAVDAEGNPQYQGIDTSFLVATLTAAIQELKAELDTVKAELAVLKGTA